MLLVLGWRGGGWAMGGFVEKEGERNKAMEARLANVISRTVCVRVCVPYLVRCVCVSQFV